jgi:transposase-like protein
VSSKQEIKETEAEIVRKKVDKMYENYGLDPTGSDDGDLSRVYRHYRGNPKELEVDYQKSKEHAEQFEEEDVI